MRSLTVAVFLCALVGAACREDSGPALTASDLRVFAPLPGRTESVAYVTLSNDGRKPVVINRVASPAFARVAMHETRIVDGVAKMRRVEAVVVDAGRSVEFREGGLHLMLMEPRREVSPGDGVRLEFHYDEDGLLMLDAPLRARDALGD